MAPPPTRHAIRRSARLPDAPEKVLAAVAGTAGAVAAMMEA
ncbi:hypothetical protein C8E08_2561 [Paracidovorax citrulli]|nr:hypothetical protein C8E08_2561 [Paracidovorax citrulli]REG70602.1 hypothetical protein C8E07_3814 [Paracidovorax citrulli]RLJ95154.1 hypothetical protein C8E06_3809 [Paracidovorax citrulli]